MLDFGQKYHMCDMEYVGTRKRTNGGTYGRKLCSITRIVSKLWKKLKSWTWMILS
jgi:hypothetical protein